jgi:DNA-directed RNA polymerase specialized sigma24 family protein
MMREVRALYTWRLSPAELARLDCAERRAVVRLASIEPEILAYLTVCIRDPDVRSEALADVLAVGWEGVGPESTMESLRTVAMTEARKRSAAWKGYQRHTATPSIDVERGKLDPPIDAASPPDKWVQLDLALTVLRREERIALELWAIEDKSDREIAAALGCKLATVRKLRQRAKAQLRRRLSSPRQVGNLSGGAAS